MTTISVITICFNNLEELQKTCAAVDAQTLHPQEHWIINGSTQPAIAEWLTSHPQPAYRKFLNERDQGISDAFNKGITKATQDYTHLLHAGDVYADNQVLEDVMTFLDKHPNIDWISGRITTNRGGVMVEVGKPFDAGKLYRGMRSVAHPTWFVRRAVYDQVGLFSLDEKIAMDYDLLCRLTQCSYAFFPRVITRFDHTGTSNQHYLQSLRDNVRIYEKYFGFSIACRLWQGRLYFLHQLLQTKLGKQLMLLKKRLGLENM